MAIQSDALFLSLNSALPREHKESRKENASRGESDRRTELLLRLFAFLVASPPRTISFRRNDWQREALSRPLIWEGSLS
jgi:hypothetical protein